MLKRLTRSLVLAALAALFAPLALPGAALAHEERVVGGKYQLAVGFLNEPPTVDQMNGLDLRVSVPSENDKPAEGLDQTLKAEVIVGGNAKSMPLALEPVEDLPGAYVAHFIPTQEGSYIFHITGSVEGTPVDERFESGPGRFDDVQSAQPLQFPQKLPDGLAMAGQLRAAQDEADSARLMGIGGLVFGLAGLLAGGIAILRSRRPTPNRPSEEEGETEESRAA